MYRYYNKTCFVSPAVRTYILEMEFQILLSPAVNFEGDIVLALSVRLYYGLRKVHQRRIVKSLASNH